MKKSKKIVISESQFKGMISHAVKEEAALHLPYYPSHEQDELNEMARINKKETGQCFFPFDAWELKIWSNDHEPPHFHILKDGWNVSFLIETGTLDRIEEAGTKQSVFNYMVTNVKKWLDCKCFAQPKITNRENAMLQWEQLH